MKEVRTGVIILKFLKICALAVIIFILGSIVVNRALFAFFPGLVASIGFASLPNPAIPAITYGEFPFRLVYELNGEQIIIEDTIICEFEGIGIDAGRGKHRRWSARFASNGEEVTYRGVVLLKDDEKTIYMNVGGPNYYMRDLENMGPNAPREDKGFDNSFRMVPTEGFGVLVSEEDLLEKYNIKIIEWTHSPQIENRFR